MSRLANSTFAPSAMIKEEIDKYWRVVYRCMTEICLINKEKAQNKIKEYRNEAKNVGIKDCDICSNDMIYTAFSLANISNLQYSNILKANLEVYNKIKEEENDNRSVD